MAQNSFLANATIAPSVFVILDPSSSEKVVTCSASTAYPVGISQQGTKAFPTPAGNTDAANVGDQIQVYGPGDVCLIQTASAVTAGNLLASNTTGQAIVAPAGSSSIMGAIALETLSSSGLCRVQVTPPIKL